MREDLIERLQQRLSAERAVRSVGHNAADRERAELIRLLTEAAAALEAAREDGARLDWLADRDNPIGNVQLPSVCMMNNMHDMRAAIDEAMRLDPELYSAIDQARGKGVA